MGNHFQEEFVEEYLEALHRLDDGSDYVRNRQLSKHLEISPASVTEMMQRLAERGYIEYQRYYGAKLTRKGRQRAAQIHNRHRLLELFLGEVLGLEAAQLHETACKLEHALTPQLESLMAELVRHVAPPELELPPCPDDAPATATANARLRLLDSLPPAATATVRAVLADTDSREALAALRLTTGTSLTRTGPTTDANSGALTFTLKDSGELSLDPALARRVLVEG